MDQHPDFPGQSTLDDELNELIVRKMAENKLLHKLHDVLTGDEALKLPASMTEEKIAEDEKI